MDLPRGYQKLFRNWVIIKGAFGFVEKHVVRHDQLRWNLFAPLYLREISGSSSDRIKKCMVVLGLSVNQGFRMTASRKRGQLGARPNIMRQRE